VEEMARLGWAEGGMAWVWRRQLLAWEEDSVRECILLLHNVVLQVNVFDKWRWLLDLIHGYSVREAYRHITTFGEQMDRSLVDDVCIDIFLQRCLCLCGVFFVTDFQLKTICCGEGLFTQMRSLVVMGVENQNLLLISS